MPRTILIVDDELMNREILRNMLSRDYDILAAEGGNEALAVLEESYSLISAVLLDLKMPGMDGYELLKLIRADERYRAIPAIVATSMNDIEAEEKAVSLGAYGFVTKPYRSVLIKRHLNNAISFRETAALQNRIRRDDLTKILNMLGFTEQAEAMIKSRPLGYYLLSCFDVDSFKVINDQYGSKTGDRVLRHLAENMDQCVSAIGGICCRISADDFATLYPASFLGSDILKQGMQRMVSPDFISRSISIHIGRYLVDEGGISVNTMYDRAMLAKESIRGQYDTFEATYNNAMRQKLLHEQEIVSEMSGALAAGQFEVWYQPQFNHASGAMIGSEALVRWQHPERGLIPPGEFIPVFERSGFISALDKYIWEQVCANLRRWTDLGRNPLPVSVNISREDISKGNTAEFLTDLIDKYELDKPMLRLEITESAFAESSDTVAAVVRELIDRGFTVEIDDFGSGYSSLNTLKDVPAQILKLDMKFLDTGADTQRGGNIIESVVRMAKWLGMSVIAEGVETLEQANYLRSIGCRYIQGYLYAKPMPLKKYEEFCAGNSKEEHLLALETVDNLDNNSFWDPESMDTLIFNSYVGGACIYEYHDGRIELLRATEKYAKMFGSESMTVEDALRLNWSEHLDGETAERIARDLETSIATKDEVAGEYVFYGLPGCPHETYLRSTMRVIATAGERYLVYCTNENVTAQRQAEKEARESAGQIKTLLDDMPGGFTRMLLRQDGTSLVVFANDGFLKMRDLKRDEVVGHPVDILNNIHPDDLEGFIAERRHAMETGGLLNTKYRLRKRDGSYTWTQLFARYVRTESGDTIVNCYYADLSEMEKRKLSLQETMPFILSAIMESSENLDFAKDKDFNYICCSPAFVRFTRQKSAEDVIGHNDYDFWTKEEADRFRADDMRLFEGGEPLINFTEPIPSDDGVQHYSVTSKYILRDSAGEIIGLYGSGRDITDTRAALDRLQLLTDSIPGGIASYAVSPEGIRITYFNDGFCAMLGCTREEYTRLSAESVNSRVLPEDLPALMAQVKRLYDTGEPIDCTYRNLRADGEGIITVNFRGVLVERRDDTAYVNAVLYDVSAQKEAEQKARETAERLSVIMENIRGGVSAVTVAEDGQISFAFANGRFYEILGFTKEQFEAEVNNATELVFPEDIGRVRAAMNRVIATREPDYYEYRCHKRDGSTLYLRCNAACTSISGVGSKVLLSVITDITEVVEAREKEASAQRSLLDNLPGGAGIYDYKDGKLSLTYQNKNYWELVGLRKEDYPDRAPMSAVHPDDVPVIMNELRSALQQNRDIDCDIRMKHLTKGYRPIHLAGRIEHREDGGFRIYATFTPMDSAELTYQQTLPLLLSTIMEASNDFAFAKDRDLRYICCSPAFLKLASLSDERDVIGKTDMELFPADMAEQFRKNDLELLETGKPMVDFDETIHFPDGSVHYCLASKHILRDAAGEAIGIYGVSRDVTEQRDALEQLQLVSDSLPGGIATYSYRDGAASIEYCNEGFCRLFGGSREGLMQRGNIDPIDWVFAQDLPALREHIETLARDGTPFDSVFRVHVIGGGYKWINEKAVFSHRRGDAVLFNVILLDITERQNYSEQLRISEEETALAVQHSGNIVCRYIVAERTLEMVSSSGEKHGLPDMLTDVPYEPVRLGLISPETADAYIRFFEDIIKGNRAGSVLFQQKYFGQWRWEEAQSSTVFSDDGAPVKAVISMSDVSERIEKENIYKKWQQSLTDRAPESYTLFTTNISHRSDYDTREGLLLGFDFDHAGADANEVARAYAEECIYKEDRDKYVAFVNADTMLASYYRGRRSDSIEYRELTGDGGTRWLRLSIDLVEYPSSTDVEAYMMYEDIDEAKREELQTRELSETDPLTGVLNRATFATRVDRILQGSGPDVKHALLMLDLDGFKQVNDVFGHGEGDRTLIELAAGLKAIMRHDDLVARLGGDEFVVFLNGIQSESAAINKAIQIRSLARKAFSMEVQISASVGIALSPHDGVRFETLYKKADSALYFVKGSGKDEQALYSESMADQHLEPEPDTLLADGKKLQEKKRRMLIVDDNSIDYAMLQNIFRDEFIIEKAKDGATALIRLRHYGSAISVVLLDLNMPGMSGFEVLEKMQESGELKNVPVIIVSGDESRDTCLKAIRKGATDFITKPVDVDLLRIRVHSAVSKAENERLRAKNSMLEVQSEERLRYDAALENTGISFVEFDWHTGKFTYHPSISRYILGVFDERSFWQILLSDMVADTRTVQTLQQITHAVAQDKERRAAAARARLKTPSGETHEFRVTVRRMANEFGATSRLMISLVDLDYEVTDERRRTV